MSEERPTPEDLLEVAVEAAEAGACVLVEMRGRALRVDAKSGPLDLVTQVDRAAEAAVLDVIAARRPGDAVLAEERGRVGTGRLVWIVDPLDGTTNYTHDLPHYAVSVAVYDEAEAVGLAAAIVDPVRRECFRAARGCGGEVRGPWGRRPLQVTRPSAPHRVLAATGFAYRKHGEAVNVEEFARVLRHVQGVRRAGAATLDLAYVAAGRLDAFWEYRLGPWDTAAGALLVCEAGGVVGTVDGTPWSPFASSVAAGHPDVLADLLPVIRGGAAPSA